VTRNESSMNLTKPTNAGFHNEWGRFMETAEPFYRNFETIGGRNHLKYFHAMASCYEGGGVIELGSGRGTISQYMMEYFPQHPVVALDASQAALRRMREFFVSRGMRLPVCFNAYSDDIPAKDSVYGLVCSVGLFEHFTDSQLSATLQECNRVVKEDGWNFHVVIYPTKEGRE